MREWWQRREERKGCHRFLLVRRKRDPSLRSIHIHPPSHSFLHRTLLLSSFRFPLSRVHVNIRGNPREYERQREKERERATMLVTICHEGN